MGFGHLGRRPEGAEGFPVRVSGSVHMEKWSQIQRQKANKESHAQPFYNFEPFKSLNFTP